MILKWWVISVVQDIGLQIVDTTFEWCDLRCNIAQVVIDKYYLTAAELGKNGYDFY